MVAGETRAADPGTPLEQGMAAGMQELLVELLPCSSGDPPAVFYLEEIFLSKEERIFFSHPMMENKGAVEGMGHGLSSLPQCF